MKISIIGAGNVGSALAERILARNLADVVLVDVADGLAKGKALDLLDATPIMGYKKTVIGTSDYKEISASGIIVVTAGFPRKPGMSRDDLIQKNANIIKTVLKNIKEFSPETIILVVTNPLDIMTYLAYKEIKCAKHKILGMAGGLDTSRFKALLSQESGFSPDKIETFVLGSHGDTMVPLVSKTLLGGKPIAEVLAKEKIAELVGKTKKRGGEIVGLLKSGSAYFSPSAACFEILSAIMHDEKKIIPCSAIMEGEYGIKDSAIGVPVRIGKEGISEIIEWELPGNELDALKASASAVKNVLNKL
ncbi:MAG: malate dehydrogenase [Candidatus Omnitrophica bacterium]|nr:malate dehydrogenase [Candidatus Omnitrophota bacterium]